MFFKIRFLKKFRNIHKKTPVSVSLFNKVASLQTYNFIKKRLQHGCFPVNIAKFLRRAFLIEHLPWLPLHLLIFTKVCLYFVMQLATEDYLGPSRTSMIKSFLKNS